MTKTSKLKSLCAALALATSGSAFAANYSFAGNFSQDDEVQLFRFTADGASTLTLVSYGYGGGMQNNGNAVSAGGFDTVLTIYSATGAFVVDNDDADDLVNGVACSVVTGVNADPSTGNLYDACLSANIAAGDYIVALTQWDNFSRGATLAHGFFYSGMGNFTGGNCTNGMFCDDLGNNRSSAWAFDILQVDQAQSVTLQPSVPEPGSAALVALALGGLGLSRCQRKAEVRR